MTPRMRRIPRDYARPATRPPHPTDTHRHRRRRRIRTITTGSYL